MDTREKVTLTAIVLVGGPVVVLLWVSVFSLIMESV